MNVHEYQAKAVLRSYGVSVPRGHAAFTPEEAVSHAKTLGGPVWVVKSQIHAGGRGKGQFKESEAGGKGGVRVVKSIEDVRIAADQMLTNTLVTIQTGPQGKVVKRLLIEEGAAIAKELYLSFLVDRATSRISIIASTEGGMDIEEVAHKTPEKIASFAIDPASGYSQFHGREVAFALGLKDDQVKQCVKLIGNLYRAFTEKDMSLLEINPLIVTDQGNLVCLDAKLDFDGNALYRHPDTIALRDLEEEDPAEVLASRYDLSYVKLDGSIGCLVNGAGLAMATMDIIKLYGSEPANFSGCRRWCHKRKVTEAFKIILSDKNVKGILVNIFGGIMRCDIIAEGIVAAAREMSIQVPLVVRLEGTNVELGKQILRGSGLAVIPADNLADAAEKIVSEVRKAA